MYLWGENFVLKKLIRSITGKKRRACSKRARNNNQIFLKLLTASSENINNF